MKKRGKSRSRQVVRALSSCALSVAVLSCGIQRDAQLGEGQLEPVTSRVLDSTRLLRAPVRHRMGRRVEQTRLRPRIMPLADRYHPLLASEAMGSIAVGTVTEGYLARAAEIPFEGPHHAILQRVRKRHTRFTSDEMRDLLMCVAERVAERHPGHKLFLGNLSRRGGGDIPWSVSHNNGRDADIAYLSRSPDGQATTPEHLYHFDRKLQATDSPDPIVFDVAANWTMIKALLTCPKTVVVEKLFIARWLRYPILRYARAAKEPKELRYAAARLLRQPRRTSPHSDHLHLRIGCPPDDIAEGCVRPSRAPDAAIGAHKLVKKRLARIRKSLGGDASAREAAAYLLGLYHDTVSIGRIAKLLRDEEPSVRIRAVAAIVRMGGAEYATAIHRALSAEQHLRPALAMLAALAQLGATELLAERLRDPRLLATGDGLPATPIRGLALQQLAESESLAAAHAVVALIADPAAGVRAEALRTIERLVNCTTTDLVLISGQTLSADGVSASVPIAPVEQAVLWQRFLASIPAARSRTDVVLDGFRRRGLPIATLSREELDSLAVALSWESPYRDNAARFIAKALDYFPEIGRGSRAHPHAFWLPFLARRRLIDREAVERGVLAAESQVAGLMSVLDNHL